jgi:hypothetical protein
MAEVSLIDASAKPVQALRAGAQGLAKFCTFPKKDHSPGDDDEGARQKAAPPALEARVPFHPSGHWLG